MPFSVNDLLFGFAIPAGCAGVVLALLRLVPWSAAHRMAAPVALASGFLLAYWLVPIGPWEPSRYWRWMPYAVLLMVSVGPVSATEGVSHVERGLLFVGAFFVVAWFFVPTWETIEPTRHLHVIIWATSSAALAALLAPLGRKFCGAFLPAVLAAVLICAAFVVIIAGSLRYGQMALSASSAMFGVAIAGLWFREREVLAGAAPVFSVLVAGPLLFGFENDQHDLPLLSYYLVAAAPLSLWLCAFGPLSKLTGWKRWLTQIGLPALVCLIGVILAAAYGLGSGGE